MSNSAAVFNMLMLMGFCLFGFKLFWAVIFGTVHGVFNVVKKGRALFLHVAVVGWGFSLASLTALTVSQARQLKPELGFTYQAIGIVLLTLFCLSDRFGSIWIAERKLDKELQAIVKVQHPLVALIWIYAIVAILFWPDFGHLRLNQWWVRSAQRILGVPGIGIFCGVFGIIYEIGMIRRIIKFLRIGPKGMPPFPDSLRNE